MYVFDLGTAERLYTKHRVCEHCGSGLIYNPSDVHTNKEILDYEMGKGYMSKYTHFIICPICDKIIEVENFKEK